MQKYLNAILNQYVIPCARRVNFLENAEFHYRQGRKRTYLGNLQAAIQEFTKAVRLDPGHERAYYDRGLLYKATGDIKRALEDLSIASDLYREKFDTACCQEIMEIIQQMENQKLQINI